MGNPPKRVDRPPPRIPHRVLVSDEEIILPLTFPALAAFAIFQFLRVWNELLVALVFLGTGSETAILTAQLNELVGTRGEDWHLLTAGAFITMAVPLLVFLSLQRFFVRGLLAGSVKG